MPRCVVTGSAGFVGSHLCDRLIQEGHDVVGIDSLTDNYPQSVKKRNLARALQSSRFSFVQEDLLDADLDRLLTGAEYVFHLAGQPGVRESWGKSFEVYVQRNILATQRLLESMKSISVRKVLFASSSSVYGDAEAFPTPETALPRPVSPYGVTKLASEHLCYLYWKSYGLPVVSVRYFTVYGPRQRPDMAFNRFLGACLAGRDIEVYGDGKQTRDFTYVDDAVDGTLAAAFSSVCGEVFNIGGGSRVSLNEVLDTIEAITAKKIRVRYVDRQPGDAQHTSADVRKARELLNFAARVDLATGLRNQAAWFADNIDSLSGRQSG